MFAKFLATLALVVLVAALFIGLGHPDLSGFQSLFDSFVQGAHGLADYIGGIIKALIPSVSIGADPVWILVGLVALGIILWIIWKR